jgi:ubiquinone/menaquinone biosynthesis C-methylase UbiE
MNINPNREIYEKNYVPAQLELAPKTAYDAKMMALRMRLLETYCVGKDVLDLCCGSGDYLIKLLDKVKSIAGLDFSRTLLGALKARLAGVPYSEKVRVVEGDATSLPFELGTFDTVFSFTSLYYVPDGAKAISEAARVLRPGGVAILELGNLFSLATITSLLCHKYYGWARPFHMRYGAMMKALAEAGFAVEEHYAFQLLPMFGPKMIQILLPFSLSLFKYPLGIHVRGRMLDNIISGAPLLRRFAFRHLFVLRKVT